MAKRFLALLLSAIMLMTVPVMGAEIPDYIPDEFFDHSEGIAEAARNFEKSYSFGKEGVSVDTFSTIVKLMYSDNPELFHLSSNFSYTHPFGNPDVVLSIIFDYKMSKEEYTSAIAEVEAWADGVVALADDDFTDYEHALFFHDYLDTAYDYDTDLKVKDLYSFIKTGVGVCQAYTHAYTYLLRRAGVDVSFASSEEMNHIWNIVKIDGEWYHADVSWDDPTGGAMGKAKHDFFLYSDTGLMNNKTPHVGWIALHECTSDRFDPAPTADSLSSYAYTDGNWYYIKKVDDTVTLFATDDPVNEGSAVATIDKSVWHVWDSDAFYTNIYIGLYAAGGCLYFNNTESVLKYDPASGKVTKVYTYRGGDGYIYGVAPILNSDGTFDPEKAHIRIAQKPAEPLGDLLISTVPAAAGGDVNNDGSLTLSDVTLSLQYIARWSVDIPESAADLDGDGKITLTDVTVMLKRIAGWVNA